MYAPAILGLPDLETIAHDAGAAMGSYTYLVVGVLAFLETGFGVGLVLPGELAVVIGGVTAGQGHTDLVLLASIVWAAAFAGDVTSYTLGRVKGRGFILRHGAKVKITPHRLEQVEGFLGRHGGKTIVVGRFIGFVRTLAPFAAGASRMRARRFVPWAFVASGLWAAAFSVLGYVFWRSFDQAAAIAKQGTFALVAVVAVVVAVSVLRRRRAASAAPVRPPTARGARACPDSPPSAPPAPGPRPRRAPSR